MIDTIKGNQLATRGSSIYIWSHLNSIFNFPQNQINLVKHNNLMQIDEPCSYAMEVDETHLKIK